MVRISQTDPTDKGSLDHQYMLEALRLGEARLGNVAPNPAVGCVIVGEGAIVGRGSTAPGGRPHAETIALADAGERASDATAYVTLEPCAHQGETPPCTEALIASGVARVVYALDDPDSRVAGKGRAALEAAGIEVLGGLCESQAARINQGYLLARTKGRPLVSLKLATTLDGRIGTKRGTSEWITGAASRQMGHHLRATHDAIMVGIGTVLADDPDLTCRSEGKENLSPIRIVMDRQARLPTTSRLAMTVTKSPVWVVSECENGRLSDMGLNIIKINNNSDINNILNILVEKNITRLLVEGGPKLATSFIAAGLVDRIYWFRAPTLAGDDGRPAFLDLAIDDIADLRRFRRTSCEALGDDLLEILEPAD